MMRRGCIDRALDRRRASGEDVMGSDPRSLPRVNDRARCVVCSDPPCPSFAAGVFALVPIGSP